MTDEGSQHEELGMLGEWVDDTGEAPTGNVASESFADQLLIHSLLRDKFELDSNREIRIKATLDRFDKNELDVVPTAKAVASNSRPGLRFPKLKASLAALILVSVCIWYVARPNSAEAAFRLVIASVEENVTRVYQGRVKGRWFGIKRNLSCTLHSCGANKFVAQIHNTLVTPKVIGSNGADRWFVSGRRTWNSSDPQTELRDFLIDRITIRNLEVNRLIAEIPSNYQVELLDAEPLPGDEVVKCSPIEATLVAKEKDLPELVRIWAHPHTGVVCKILIRRDRGGRKAPTTIELTLEKELAFDGEIFEPKHYLED